MEESTLGPIAERYGLLEPLGSLCSHPAPPGEGTDLLLLAKQVAGCQKKSGQRLLGTRDVAVGRNPLGEKEGLISEIMSSKVVGRLEQKVGQIEAETAVAVVQESPSFDDCLSS
ncbi:hypothetical protein G6F46_011444 [Rhizopus delemar]|uniref:Uncharacterized protein n=2 Tax=Rhizopus TaxID=4842 RepID=A0A9P6YT69_9FUNG|nr:hypothetical protein G6F36_013925 [Rhizopus arrhizus]KAG1447926.1 hypothetical protein G6F55_010890 [Rhizopus delemar]KAG1489830.1 hypothetical protein G6F54_011159 [Rhizopus delemar]KAG1500495.1 hypothetical protein G6F53_011292 [Rhizopus delemar]KAG1516729.1 hypothetical protein G6F52_009383 [Rhizopus delemar]